MFQNNRIGESGMWTYLTAIVLGLIVLIFLIWLATKSVNIVPSVLP